MTYTITETSQGTLVITPVTPGGQPGTVVVPNLVVGGRLVTTNGLGTTTASNSSASINVTGLTGNDVSGRVFTSSANVGSAPGGFAYVQFANAYTTTPIVIVTPNTPSTNIGFWVTASTNSFTVNIAGSTVAGSLGFNYAVFGQ